MPSRRRFAGTRRGQKPRGGAADGRRQQAQAGVVERIDDHRHVIVERRLPRSSSAGTNSIGSASTLPATAPSPSVCKGSVPDGEPIGRQQRQRPEHREEPDDEREHDVDDQALVEEAERPGKHRLDARNPRNRQQQGEQLRRSPRAPTAMATQPVSSRRSAASEAAARTEAGAAAARPLAGITDAPS